MPSSPLPSLTYFAPRDVLIPRVARQCIMQFCEALSQEGADVRLVALDVRLQFHEPTRTRPIWDVYGIQQRFPVTMLGPKLPQDVDERLIGAQRVLRYGAYAFAHGILGRGLIRRPVNALYTRNPRTARILGAVARRRPDRVVTLLELQGPVTPESAARLPAVDGLVANSQPIADELLAAGVDPARVLVGHTGVKLQRFTTEASKGDIRSRLHLPGDGFLVVYTGKVHRGYAEVELLLETARRLPPDAHLLLVGGRSDHVEHFQRRLAREGPANARFRGFVAPSEVHQYQLAADVLVMSYPRSSELNDYRSPAKLLEYLATGNPVVAARYRSTSEIVGDAGLLVEPDSPDELAAAILRLRDDPTLARNLGSSGRQRVERFTWEARARNTLEFVERLSDRKRSAARRGGSATA